MTGRKVWTSYAQFATWGLCLARTDPDAPRPQQGISALIVDMAAPGVEVRPLVQMTGDAEFNEVFLTDVFVPAEQLVGIEGQGWTVAGSTLAHERGTNFPFKEQVVHETYLARLYDAARANGSLDDPLVADALAQAYVDLGRVAPAQPAHAHPARTGRGAGPRVELGQAHLDDHDPGHGRRRAARHRARPASAEAGPVGAGSGSGARRPASPAVRHRSSATSSPGAFWVCRADPPRPLQAGPGSVRRAATRRRRRTKNTVISAPAASPTTKAAMSCQAWWPENSRPSP